MKDKIKELLRETSAPKQPEEKQADKALYNAIQSTLKNNAWNHAHFVEKIWGDKDDASLRSSFRKKLHQEPKESGKPHTFTNEELEKIASELAGVSAEVRKLLGKKYSGEKEKETRRPE